MKVIGGVMMRGKLILLFYLILTLCAFILNFNIGFADTLGTSGTWAGISQNILCSTARQDGTLVMAGAGGRYQILNADNILGTTGIWKWTGESIVSAVTRSNGDVVLVSRFGYYQILKTDNTLGKSGMWEHSGYETYAATVRHDDSVVLVGSGGRFQILNADNTWGLTQSNVLGTNIGIFSVATKIDGSVVLASINGIRILYPDNTFSSIIGSGLWEMLSIRGMTVRADGSVLLLGNDGRYQVLNTDNSFGAYGASNVLGNGGASGASGAVRPDGSTILAQGNRGQLYVLSPSNTLGSVFSWTHGTWIMTATTRKDGSVFLGGESGLYQIYNPSSSIFDTSITATSTSISVNSTWNSNPLMGWYTQYSTNGVTWTNASTFVNGTSTIGGLNTNAGYYVRIRYNHIFYSSPIVKYTSANTPTSLTVSSPAQSSLTISWNANGNLSGTIYELYCNTTGQTIYTGTSTNFTHTGLSSGTQYSYKVRAKNGDNIYTSYTGNAAAWTIPSNPTVSLQSSGRISWSNNTNNRGRCYAVLNWGAVPGATGYRVWVFDGYTWTDRYFDVGNVTSWDSRVWRIMPTDATLRSYGDNTQPGNLYNQVKGGQDLPDTPNLLYQKTAATTYDSAHNYWFYVTAYNSSGESSYGNCITPTLVNSTDTTVPTVSNVEINGGASNTGSKTVNIVVSASDPLVTNYTSGTSDDASGVVKYQVSNDNFSSYLEFTSNTFDWTMTSGEGSKTVYVRAVDAAGNPSVAYTSTIYLMNDVTPPNVSVSINNGANQTDSRYVIIAVTANDNLSTIDLMDMRASLDGSTWKSYNGSSWDSGWGDYKAVCNNFDLGTTGGKKYIFIQVRDANGNIGNAIASINYYTSNVAPAAGADFSAPPVTTTSLGENMNGQVVSISGVVMQVVQTNSVDMQITGLSNVSTLMISFDGINWSVPEIIPSGTTTYTKSVTFNQQGKLAIYLKFQNGDGMVSPVITRRFLVDYQSPEGTVSCVGSDATSGNTIQLSVKYKDNISNRLSYSINGGAYNVLPSSGLISAPVSSQGLNDINIKIIDEAGNVASDTVSVWGL